MPKIGTTERGLVWVAVTALVAPWVLPMIHANDWVAVVMTLVCWGTVGGWFLSSAARDGKRRTLEARAREIAEDAGGVISPTTVIDQLRNEYGKELYPGWQSDVASMARKVAREARADARGTTDTD